MMSKKMPLEHLQPFPSSRQTMKSGKTDFPDRHRRLRLLNWSRGCIAYVGQRIIYHPDRT